VRHHPFHILPDPVLVGAGIRPHHDVLQNGELRKNLPSLGNVADPHPDDPVGVLPVDPLSQKFDGPLFRLFLLEVVEQPHDRLEGRRLSRPVGSQQGHDVALLHLERDPVQRPDQVVPGFDIAHLQHPRSSPRYARITSGWLWTSAGVPSTIFSPWLMAKMRSEIPMIMFMSCSISRIVTR